MKDERAFETLLTEALGRKGAPAPFAIDVADRVMARVAAMGPPPRTEMDLRQLRRWAIAASIVGAALTSAAVWQGPSLAGLVSSLGLTMANALSAALKLGAPAGALVEAFGRVALALLTSARTLLQTLEPLRPLAQASLAATAAAMLFVTILVVGRDMRARAVEKEHV